ncbi:MAG: DNA recombination protein RmuC [Acetobacteraceae bacterium]|nr:DNA recombination protein RmuC [Acetobacteraceae bacterium]
MAVPNRNSASMADLTMPDLTLLLTALAAYAAIVAAVVAARQSRSIAAVRVLAEQALHGVRAEAEATRAAVHATATQAAVGLAASRGALDTGIEQIRTAMEVRSRELRESNDASLASLRLAVDEQLRGAVEKQMSESFSRVIDQFAAVQKAIGEVSTVAAGIGDIKRLFGNVKNRGGWAETQVRSLLDDILPPDAWLANHKVRPDSDEMVEFAILMPMRGIRRPVLAVDAKFPLEDHERLIAASAAGDQDGERLALRGLERRVRDEARKIASKYIFPPVTVEFAVLYLPTDGLHAEVARIPGLIDGIGREFRVLVMGPTLFPALLRTIHLGFVTLALEDKADEIRDLLGVTRSEMVKMDDVLERLSRQAGAFSGTIERARVRTRAIGGKLRDLGVPVIGIAEDTLSADEPDEVS